MPADVPDILRRLADEASSHAYTPFSKRPIGAVALLSDGSWVPGVRVENASFPLTIPALTAAYSAARCVGREDLVAVAQSRPFRVSDPLYLSEALGSSWETARPDLLVSQSVGDIPTPGNRLEIYLEGANSPDDAEMLRLAEDVARGAHIPESGFPVGCVITTEDGSLVPGCNVEHADWTLGLCAERIALATALAYGHRRFRRIHLSCPNDDKSASCGACRQVMFELAPGVPIVMARGKNPPESSTPEALLPGGFRGDSLRS